MYAYIIYNTLYIICVCVCVSQRAKSLFYAFLGPRGKSHILAIGTFG